MSRPPIGPRHGGDKPRPMLPRRIWRYGSGDMFGLGRLSARQQYIAGRSIRRWEQRHNAGARFELPRGEIGSWQGVRIIRSPLPDAESGTGETP